MTDAECAALTWDTFKASFLVIFGDSDRHLKAMTKIRNLRLSRVLHYTTEFSALTGITGWDENALINAFHEGLEDPIKMEIARGVYPTSLTDIVLEAVCLDGRLFEAQKRTTPQRTPAVSYPAHRIQRDPNAMDVDAVRTGPLPRLTDDLRDQLRREGSCFRCRQQGHMARECPNCQGPSGASRVNSVASTPVPNARDEFIRNPHYVHIAPAPAAPAPASITEVSGSAEAGF
ncbi:hypothetical protein BOTBODRAFT_181505 [Botryobasidium botryosum FD-172 SS1]|uniref:CCHC-type domain-containing protein n=1 Tax=Botryobasidium botryosum (strain FD-172 SS1) TaxID=930990 RepID=A0A067LTV8_BOTB1|nr:hypothetical protein BOTBODRAFT_181505 [Botryobasidium botryosum FD-172 SS1]